MFKAVATYACRALKPCLAAAIALMACLPAHAGMTRIATRYIAALGDPQATSGTEAQTWGLWAKDPGPRGVAPRLRRTAANKWCRARGLAVRPDAWWLEEHGLIMEPPVFPLPAGRYVVTGGRAVTAVLTVAAPDAAGQAGLEPGRRRDDPRRHPPALPRRPLHAPRMAARPARRQRRRPRLSR